MLLIVSSSVKGPLLSRLQLVNHLYAVIIGVELFLPLQVARFDRRQFLVFRIGRIEVLLQRNCFAV